MITHQEVIMIRTQIQLTQEQARDLKRLAIKEKKSVAELIRLSVDSLIHAKHVDNREDMRRKAIAAAGKLNGPENLSAVHDDYLAEIFNQ
jgi:hypothetical protein